MPGSTRSETSSSSPASRKRRSRPMRQRSAIRRSSRSRTGADVLGRLRPGALFVNTAKLPSAPEALEVKIQQLQERIAALKNVQGAAAKLYELLSPQQRTVFDFIALTPMGIGTFEQL